MIPGGGSSARYQLDEAVCRMYNMPFGQRIIRGPWQRRFAIMPRKVDGGRVVWFWWYWTRYTDFRPMRAYAGLDPFEHEYRGGNRRAPDFKQCPEGMKETVI